MPYINEERRQEVLDGVLMEPGDLNYSLTYEITRYLSIKGESYRTYNDIIGVLECAKLELYRRMVAPYEDTKKEENGDVYDY